MIQTSLDYYIFKEKTKFQIYPWIEVYLKKNKLQLLDDLTILQRKFKLIDFNRIETEDEDVLKIIVIMLYILEELLENLVDTDKFDLKWQEILKFINLDFKDPSFMINSMIRETKRRISFRLNSLNKTKKRYINFQILNQPNIHEFL